MVAEPGINRLERFIMSPVVQGEPAGRSTGMCGVI